MNREIATAWCADLRAGHKQTTGQLVDGDAYCCLGRLCVVLGYSFNQNGSIVRKDGELCRNKHGASEALILPQEVMTLAGMKTATGWMPNDDTSHTELSALNDEGADFAEIADVIDARWAEL